MSTPTAQPEIVKRPLPPGWRWVKLGEVCEIIAGQSPPSETYRKTPEGLPFFQGKADFGLAHPVPHTWCIAPKTIAEPGDILISVRAPVGPTNIADVKCCIGRGLAALRPSIGIDRDFILFTLKFFEPELIKLGSGSTFQAIRREELERLVIPLPPLAEQRRIAAILREQMDAVERARRAAEEQLEAAKALPAAYLRRVFPRHGDPLPPGWRWVKLGEVCEQDRIIVEPDSPLSERLTYLSLEHIDSNTGRILKEPVERIENEGKSATFAFDGRHVLYGKLRPYLNKVALPEFPGRCTTEIIPLLPSKGVDREFLFWLLRRPETVEGAVQYKTGSRMPRADINELMKLVIPLPPLAEQRRIAAILREQMDAVERARRAAEEQLEAAKALPAAYLRRVFPRYGDPLPPGWRWVKLGEVCEVVNGFGFREDLQGRGDLPFPFIKVSDMNAIGSEIRIDRALNTVDDNILRLLGAKTYPAGTVIFPKVGGALLTNKKRILGVEATFDNNIMGIVPKFVESEWVFFWVQTIDLSTLARTQALPSIRQSEVKDLHILLPPREERRRIAAILREQMTAVERLRRTLEEQLETINKLPAAILSKAFNGGL